MGIVFLGRWEGFAKPSNDSPSKTDVPVTRKLDWNSQDSEHKTQDMFHYLWSHTSLARKRKILL